MANPVDPNDAKFAQLLHAQNTNAQQLGELTKLFAALSTTLQENASNKPSNEVLSDTLARSISIFTPGPDSTFGQWFDRHEKVFTVDGKDLDDAARARLMLRHLNQESYNKFVSMLLPKKPHDYKFQELVNLLKDLFGESKSLFQKRFDCLNVERLATEDFVTYGARVNRLCEEFLISTIKPDEFKSLMFTIGLKSDRDADTRTRMLAFLEDDTRNQSLDIAKLVQEVNRLAAVKKDNELVQSSGTIHAVKQQTRPYKNNTGTSDKPKTPCWGCGEMHFFRFCPFKIMQCPDCRQQGHKSGFCNVPKPKRRFKSDQSNTQYRTNHVVALTTSVNLPPSRKFVEVLINGAPLTLQLDNGSDFTIVSEKNFKIINPQHSRQPSHKALDASSNAINFIREFDADIILAGQTRRGCIKVTQNQHLNVLGSDFMESFGLFDRPINEVCLMVQSDAKRQFQDEFPELFSDTPGVVTQFQPRLELKDGAKPVVRPKRQVPFAKVQAVEAELDRLVKLGIITPVDYSDYAAPIVAVEKKSGGVHICDDYATGLNNQLQPCQYPLPTTDEMFAKLSGCTIFSKVDLSDAYLQIEIHPESRKLLTIHTHKGLFQFNRLAPGVKLAPGSFQQIMDITLVGLPVVGLIDDVMVATKTLEEHNRVLREVFKRLQKIGFRVKMSKCEFYKSSLKFLGFIVDANGSCPDPDKISAIVNMQAPTNVSQLRSVLGSINHQSKYVKNLRKVRAPLDDLTKKAVVWNWSPQCQRAFDELKAILTSDLCLTHYDPNLEIIVSADASPEGLGAYLSHVMPDGSEKMVACASRSLNEHEARYSQIEKEGLGLIYAVKKFHRYIYGRRFKLKTDHKPLLQIFGSHKGIPVHVANRLQRYALILLGYDFEILYVNTKDFGYVDMIFRLMQRFPQDPQDDEYVIAQVENDVVAQVLSITQRLPITNEDISTATQTDKNLQKLLTTMKAGWPEEQKDLKDPDLEPYWVHRFNLSEVNGIVMMNYRVVVPTSLRNRVLETLHEAHPGIDRMKSYSRSYVYWPNLDKDVTTTVQQCEQCAKTAKMPVKTLLKSWPVAEEVMERIHIDIAEPEKGDFYLVIVDARSKWPEVYRTTTITSHYVMTQLKEFFARYGKPQLIVSDNGKQFISDAFNQFCAEEGIEHLTTAYYQPQSNGEAERFIDTLKRHLARMNGKKR